MVCDVEMGLRIVFCSVLVPCQLEVLQSEQTFNRPSQALASRATISP